MRYSAELAARADAWLALPLAQKRSPEGLTELGSLWATMQGLPPVACRQCQYSDRARDVATYLRDYHRFTQHPDAMSDSKYTFAPQFTGEVIADGRYNKTVTAENLTDADAEALLKLDYGHVIVLKAGATAAPSTTAPTSPETAPTEREQTLTQQLTQATEQASKSNEAEKKAKQETSTAQKALKAEKDAHALTKKDLEAVREQLAELQAKLTEAQQKLTEASTPPVPAA